MSTETGGPSPEEMGTQPEKAERKMFEITDNPDGTFTTTLPGAVMEGQAGQEDMVTVHDETFNTRAEAEAAVEKAKSELGQS